MMNRVRNAHAWAALLLLAAACGDSGGGDDDKDAGKDATVETDAEADAETPEDEGGTVEDDGGGEPGGGDTDSGGTPGGDTDAAVTMDAETDADTTDTGVTADTGSGNDDAGGSSDTGVDSGPVLPTGCAETAIVAATGGSVTSTDSHFTLTLAGAQLSADATVRVCLVAATSAPSSLDGRVGDAYEITSTNSATFTGLVSFTGHSALPPVDATPTFDPSIVRALPSGGVVANGSGAVLTMSKRALAADTVTRLSATVSGPGHVYVATLEAPGIYHVNMHSPTKTAFVTGEGIDFGTTVTVTGTPVGTRVFEAEVNGCDLDPLSYAPNGTGGGLTQPGPVFNNPGCNGGAYVPVKRVGGATGNIVGSPTGTAATLASGTTLDLQAADSTPLGFYCRFPGAGKGAVRLLFKTGTTTDLEVTKDIETTCTYSGDLVAFHDTVEMAQSGSSVVPVTAPATAFVPGAYAAVIPPAFNATVVGDDGLQFAASLISPVLSTAGPGQIVGSARAGSPTQVATQTVTLAYQTDRYVATPAITAIPALFGGVADGQVNVSGDGAVRPPCSTASMAQLDLRFSDRGDGATTVAVTGSTIDLMLIQARVPAAGAAPASVLFRWINAAKLGDHAPVPLMNAAQRTAIGAATPTEYTVGLYRVSWDEARDVFDGRILPIACGTVLHFTKTIAAP